MDGDKSLPPLDMEDEDDVLPDGNWADLAQKVAHEEQIVIDQIGKPQVRSKTRKRRRDEAKKLEETRLKFIDSWVAAFNSGSPAILDQFITHWMRPNIVFREQYIHFVPHALIYREIHTTRLLYQYLLAIFKAIPDALYTTYHQTLKTRRDGSAYVIATLRVVGSYTFRLLTTNASSHMSQLVSKPNPLHSAINNDHLLNRSHFRSLFRGQQGPAPFFVSSFPAVYHSNPVEYDAYNGVLVPRDGNTTQLLSLPPCSVPQRDETSSSNAASAMSTTASADVVGYFDDEALFQEMFSALLAPADEQDDGMVSDGDEEDRNRLKRMAITENLASDREDTTTSSQSSVSGFSDKSPITSLHFSSKVHTSITSSPSAALFPAVSLPLSPSAPLTVTLNSGDMLQQAQRDVLSQRSLAANTLRAALRLVPPPSDGEGNVPVNSTQSPHSSSSSISSTVDPHTASPTSFSATFSPLNLHSTNLPKAASPHDFVKVTTPYTQFFALERLPQIGKIDVAQTFLVFFEAGSDQAHRIDVYKKDR